MRRSVLRGLVAVPLVVGGGFAAIWWLPNLVRDEIASRVEARTGVPARVGDISLGLSSIVVPEILWGAPINGSSARALAVAKRIVVSGNPLMLVLSGASAVDRIEVGELSLQLPLEAPMLRGALERVFSRRSGGPEGRSPPGGMAVEIERLDVVVSDGKGELARIRHGRIRADATVASVEIERLLLGPEGDTVLELGHVAVRGVHGKHGWQLAGAQIAESHLWLGSGPGTQTQAFGTGSTEELNVWRRILSAIDRVGSYARSKGSASDPSKGSPSDRLKAGGARFERIADAASVTIGAGSVYPRHGTSPILQTLRATATMQSTRALSLSGSGKAHSGGSLLYDLVVRPDQLQVDGRVQLSSLPLTLITAFLPAIPWHEPENGRVDADLVVKTDPAQGVGFSGEVSLRDAALASPRLAGAPVSHLGVVLRGHGRFMPLTHRVEIAEATLQFPGAALGLAATVEWDADHYLFDIDAKLPPTPCTQAVRAIPAGLLGDLALATWQGQISGHLRFSADSRALDDLVLEIAPEDRCQFVMVPAMADLQRFRSSFVHTVDEPDGSVFEMETGPGTPTWTYIEDISPFFVHAVLAHEDAGFFTHRGFSPRHIRDALARDLKERRYAVGASTITMQLVKNIFLRREKTLARKIQEVLLTWWIERVMDKRDILELYLNVIEYGPGVYGIRNGARHYFNRLPAQLSPAESVYLATILPNPKRYHAHFERGAVSPAWAEIMRKLLTRLGERGSYTAEAVAYGLRELSTFHFVPEGHIVDSRQITGTAAPLPYERRFAPDADWKDEGEIELPEPDDEDSAPAGRTR